MEINERLKELRAEPKQKESIEKSLMETAKKIKEIIAILKCEN